MSVTLNPKTPEPQNPLKGPLILALKEPILNLKPQSPKPPTNSR